MGATAAAQARARLGHGIELASAGQHDQALSAFDEVVAEFGGQPDPEVRFEVAKALSGRASVLRQLERMDEAVASLDEVLRLAAAPPPGILDELAALAMFDRSWILEATGRSRQALAGYQQVADRFGDDPRPPLREAVARSGLNRATMVAYLHGAEAGVDAFDELLERFGDADEQGIRQALELARQYRAQLAGGGELDIRSPQQDLADTLVSEGSELGNAGRIEEATAKFEEVLRRFGQADYPALQLHVAQAGYNRGAALRLSGRPREAVDAFAEVLRRYRGSSDQALRAQCAITLFNQGIALQDDGRTQEAVDTLAEVVADYRDDEHPATRERVARALVVRADLLWELGRLAEAVATRAEVLRWFADAPEPAVREAVAAARQEQAGLLPPEPPARGRGGAAATYSEADTGLDLGRLAEEVPEVHIRGVYSFIEPKPARMSRRERRRHERDLEEGVRRQQARDARLHEQAEQVLSEYRTRGRPFALFLRNFDLEAYQARSRAGGVLIVQQDEPGDVEAKLAAALRGRLPVIPVIGIANPSLVRPDFEHPIPKLLIADEHRRDVLSRLLLAADLVVMHLEQVTPGVAAELAAILELQRQDVVVIVLRSRPAEEQQDALAEGLMSVHGIDRPQAGTPGPELLRRFPRVVLADEVPFEQLDASPPFAELLARIDALSASGR